MRDPQQAVCIQYNGVRGYWLALRPSVTFSLLCQAGEPLLGYEREPWAASGSTMLLRKRL
jgi:hypothetical protein